MALQTEPKLELREKTPCIYFMECENISIVVSLKAEYSERCPEHVALFQSWLEFMGWCQHHLLRPAGSLERLAGLCFPPTGCILVNDLFQILPCLPHRLAASESLAGRKNSGAFLLSKSIPEARVLDIACLGHFHVWDHHYPCGANLQVHVKCATRNTSIISPWLLSTKYLRLGGRMQLPLPTGPPYLPSFSFLFPWLWQLDYEGQWRRGSCFLLFAFLEGGLERCWGHFFKYFFCIHSSAGNRDHSRSGFQPPFLPLTISVPVTAMSGGLYSSIHSDHHQCLQGLC